MADPIVLGSPTAPLTVYLALGEDFATPTGSLTSTATS